jgi:NADH-quinone oxidoreductase subunit L
MILAALSALGGLLNLPGVYTLEHWLEHSIEAMHAASFVPLLAGFALLVALLGLGAAWMVYGRRPAVRAQAKDPIQERAPGLFRALNNRWWVDELYHNTIVRGYRGLAAFLTGPFDQDLIDGIVNGMGYLSRSFASALRVLQTGFVRSYALVVLFGVVAILTYLVVWQLR